MGGAETAFQEKKISGAEMLAKVMRRSLKQMTPGISIAESAFNGWVVDARQIKGEPLELAAAIDWAITKSDYWTGYLDSMEKFAAKVDVILRQYRGAAREAKILATKSGPSFSASCVVLQQQYPNMLREAIEVRATKDRVNAKGVEFKKKCPICKGKDYIPSKDRPTKGVMILCPNCQAFKSSIWDGVMRQVHEELYG